MTRPDHVQRPTRPDPTTPAQRDYLLEISKLSVRFPETQAAAVNEIGLRMLPGQTLGVVGESGSGKSTICLAIMGLTPPNATVSGSVIFRGTNLVGLSDRRMRSFRGKDISLVYQDPMAALNPVKTIGSQLRETLQVHLGMSRKQASARAVELLERVGITDAEKKLHSYPHEFSGGMRQRVVIAMAISCNPSLIIADEPTTALDVLVQAQVLELLRSLSSELGIALLLVTHDLSVIAGIADDVAVMRFGEVVEYGAVRQIFEAPKHDYTRELLARVREIEGSSGRSGESS
jgi:ABC-type dipeptide/oligopeptide/nickel transport system ATPase component